MTAARHLTLVPEQRAYSVPECRLDVSAGASAMDCPHFRCRHNLAEAQPRKWGTRALTAKAGCALAVVGAADGPISNDAVGELLGLSHGGVDRIEAAALRKMGVRAPWLGAYLAEARRSSPLAEAADGSHVDRHGDVADAEPDPYHGTRPRLRIGDPCVDEPEFMAAFDRAWRRHVERSPDERAEMTARIRAWRMARREGDE